MAGRNPTKLAKDKVIRLHKDVKSDLLLIRKELKMSSRHNEGDVVKELVSMYKSKQIGYPILDDYQSLYLEQVTLTQNWKKRFEMACTTGNLNPVELMKI